MPGINRPMVVLTSRGTRLGACNVCNIAMQHKEPDIAIMFP
jgi:hypothetical protein